MRGHEADSQNSEATTSAPPTEPWRERNMTFEQLVEYFSDIDNLPDSAEGFRSIEYGACAEAICRTKLKGFEIHKDDFKHVLRTVVVACKRFELNVHDMKMFLYAGYRHYRTNQHYISGPFTISLNERPIVPVLYRVAEEITTVPKSPPYEELHRLEMNGRVPSAPKAPSSQQQTVPPPPSAPQTTFMNVEDIPRPPSPDYNAGPSSQQTNIVGQTPGEEPGEEALRDEQVNEDKKEKKNRRERSRSSGEGTSSAVLSDTNDNDEGDAALPQDNKEEEEVVEGPKSPRLFFYEEDQQYDWAKPRAYEGVVITYDHNSLTSNSSLENSTPVTSPQYQGPSEEIDYNYKYEFIGYQEDSSRENTPDREHRDREEEHERVEIDQHVEPAEPHELEAQQEPEQPKEPHAPEEHQELGVPEDVQEVAIPEELAEPREQQELQDPENIAEPVIPVGVLADNVLELRIDNAERVELPLIQENVENDEMVAPAVEENVQHNDNDDTEVNVVADALVLQAVIDDDGDEGEQRNPEVAVAEPELPRVETLAIGGVPAAPQEPPAMPLPNAAARIASPERPEPVPRAAPRSSSRAAPRAPKRAREECVESEPQARRPRSRQDAPNAVIGRFTDHRIVPAPDLLYARRYTQVFSHSPSPVRASRVRNRGHGRRRNRRNHTGRNRLDDRSRSRSRERERSRVRDRSRDPDSNQTNGRNRSRDRSPQNNRNRDSDRQTERDHPDNRDRHDDRNRRDDRDRVRDQERPRDHDRNREVQRSTPQDMLRNPSRNQDREFNRQQRLLRLAREGRERRDREAVSAQLRRREERQRTHREEVANAERASMALRIARRRSSPAERRENGPSRQANLRRTSQERGTREQRRQRSVERRRSSSRERQNGRRH